MQNIVEILKGLGIEVPEDKASELNTEVAKNYKTVAEFEKKLSKLEGERDALSEKFNAAQETLNKFEGVDLETVKNEIADWKKKAEDAEKNYNDKIAKRDFDDALKAELENVKFSSAAAKKAVMAEIQNAGLKLYNGKIVGLSDMLDQIRENDASAFVDEKKEDLESGKARFTQKSSNGGGSMTREEILKIKDATLRQRAIAENIELFRKE